MVSIEEIEVLIDNTLSEEAEQPVRSSQSIDSSGPRVPIDEPPRVSPTTIPWTIRPGFNPNCPPEPFTDVYQQPFELATAELKRIVIEFLSITIPGNTERLQLLIDRVADAGKLRAIITNLAFANPPIRISDHSGIIRLRPGCGAQVYEMDIRLSFTVPQPEPEVDDDMV